ncbi:HPr family phosphocarrier protein [bacterium C-53]|nr:HPr family phosphocarrier protein [Lachnospiraceae bacterium]NBI04035.1 HPr family phosphocarrier protein [Lachnospiraceae bacterium]RKJ08843.1 HPr family phosphocarrier protein [bacterium C-53]
MRERKIRLNPELAKEFVSTSTKCDFDIDIFYNRVIIDAKSILGVLGLDFGQELTVKYAGYNNDFERMIDKLAVVH